MPDPHLHQCRFPDHNLLHKIAQLWSGMGGSLYQSINGHCIHFAMLLSDVDKEVFELEHWIKWYLKICFIASTSWKVLVNIFIEWINFLLFLPDTLFKLLFLCFSLIKVVFFDKPGHPVASFRLR